ncbi:lipoprotein [Ahrensia sp. R2A130]|nr:lipoprotein [Ahrensia sp. R2A130]
MVLGGFALLLTGCGDAVTVTAEERSACDEKVKELFGRAGVGEQVGYHVRTTNGTKTARLIYQQTTDFPGAQCDLLEGKVVSVVKFEQIFPTPGDKI